MSLQSFLTGGFESNPQHIQEFGLGEGMRFLAEVITKQRAIFRRGIDL